jgi:hypothetical protein
MSLDDTVLIINSNGMGKDPQHLQHTLFGK